MPLTANSVNLADNRFRCPCCGVDGCTPELKAAVCNIEAIYGKLPLNSSFRCSQHQANLRQAWVRGKIEWSKTHPNQKYPQAEPSLHSQHSTGKAIDVACREEKQADLIAAAKRCGFKGIIRGKTFVHLDMREHPYESTY